MGFELAGEIPAIVEVYDNTLTYKGAHQTGVGEFIGCEFTLDESGGTSFILVFADFADIEKRDIIKILLFGQTDYFFTGVVREIPIDGSTKSEFNYTGFGLGDYLIRKNTESQSYAAQTINTIVNDLLDNVIVPNTPITKNAAKIDALTTVVTAIDFKYISCQNAMKQLKDIAQSDGNEYIVGVDQTGEFFFKQRSTSTIVTLVNGKQGIYGIENYEPEDSIEERSKYFVLNKDGTFQGTVTSTEDIDLFEEKLTAPDIDDADVLNWANGILLTKEQETRQATILWQIEQTSPIVLVADGNIRILSNIPPTELAQTQTAYGAGLYGAGLYGGGPLYSGKDLDDTLKIKQVQYIVNNSQAIRNIELGSLPVELSQAVIDVNKNVTDLRVSLGR
jgi:hypothetical protein